MGKGGCCCCCCCCCCCLFIVLVFTLPHSASSSVEFDSTKRNESPFDVDENDQSDSAAPDASQDCDETNCAWSAWNSWTPCSVSCGAGVRARTRQCVYLMTSVHPVTCAGDDRQQETCLKSHCPNDKADKPHGQGDDDAIFCDDTDTVDQQDGAIPQEPDMDDGPDVTEDQEPGRDGFDNDALDADDDDAHYGAGEDFEDTVHSTRRKASVEEDERGRDGLDEILEDEIEQEVASDQAAEAPSGEHAGDDDTNQQDREGREGEQGGEEDEDGAKFRSRQDSIASEGDTRRLSQGDIHDDDDDDGPDNHDENQDENQDENRDDAGNEDKGERRDSTTKPESVNGDDDDDACHDDGDDDDDNNEHASDNSAADDNEDGADVDSDVEDNADDDDDDNDDEEEEKPRKRKKKPPREDEEENEEEEDKDEEDDDDEEEKRRKRRRRRRRRRRKKKRKRHLKEDGEDDNISDHSTSTSSSSDSVGEVGDGSVSILSKPNGSPASSTEDSESYSDESDTTESTATDSSTSSDSDHSPSDANLATSTSASTSDGDRAMQSDSAPSSADVNGRGISGSKQNETSSDGVT